MNLLIATGDHWFRFQGMAFKILTAGISSNEAYANTEPHNQALVDELCKRIQRDGKLSVYLGDNYVCFPEDYPQNLK
jgi:hypothetical protein